ncbi:hypothetical protein Vadar_033097 [Vaccinium darrowii]|uniref:Uncharacterized protein n=1 Tax=Vaccinium darrowii TaxID=229202 RepID=A0ACB7ZMX9_9ERIC|nr:hypothetical protein Vadar_033097 [Vaccinium darrowii]
MLSLQEQLNVAERYVKLLENRVQELKARRTALAMSNNDGDTSRIKLPVIELREHLGSSLEVVLITGLKKNFMNHDV